MQAKFHMETRPGYVHSDIRYKTFHPNQNNIKGCVLCCCLLSGCAYTVLDGNYIPALTIQGTMDQTLLPEDHVLRFDGNIIHNSNVYEIKTFYILKDGERNFWEEAERSHDFYTIRENSEQKIKVKAVVKCGLL